MATLAVPPRDPDVPVVEPSPTHQQLGDSAAVDASIAAYLGAGDRMAKVMRLTMIVCSLLVVLIAGAWAFRLLPGTI